MMHGNLLFNLFLTLVPFAWSNPWGPDCVEIHHPHSDEYLAESSYKVDAVRRQLGFARAGDFWVITPDGDNFKIKLKNIGEELIETEPSNNNFVFTRVPKSSSKDDDGAASWQIISVGDDKYHIKNVKFKHCLWAKGRDGWVGANADCSGSLYEWKIYKTSCTYNFSFT